MLGARTTIRLGFLIVTTGVVATACSSSDPSPPPKTESPTNACVTPGASYVVHFVERSGGTCGPVPDAVVNTTPDGKVATGNGCTGAPRSDGCDVYLDGLSCPSEAGGTVTQTGKVTWAEDGSSGAGTLQVTVKLGNGDTCVSSYDVAYARQ